MKKTKRPKLTILFEGQKGTSELKAFGGEKHHYDEMMQRQWSEAISPNYLENRGCVHFQDLNDLKETLGWNLNGEVKINWLPDGHTGYAEIYQID